MNARFAYMSRWCSYSSIRDSLSSPYKYSQQLEHSTGPVINYAISILSTNEYCIFTAKRARQISLLAIKEELEARQQTICPIILFSTRISTVANKNVSSPYICASLKQNMAKRTSQGAACRPVLRLVCQLPGESSNYLVSYALSRLLNKLKNFVRHKCKRNYKRALITHLRLLAELSHIWPTPFLNLSLLILLHLSIYCSNFPMPICLYQLMGFYSNNKRAPTAISSAMTTNHTFKPIKQIRIRILVRI